MTTLFSQLLQCRIASVLTVVVLALSGGSARAETLQEIVVVGSESSQVGEVEHSEYTGRHTRVDTSTRSDMNQSLASMLATEVGVQFRESGGQGSYSTVTVRAASSAQTAVYFDGVLLNNAANGGVDLSQFELLNIEQVDIYRGVSPVQLGVGGIGGAVNLQSTRSRDVEGSEASVRLGVGSFGARQFQLAWQKANTQWDTSIAVGRLSSDNNYTLIEDNGTPLNQMDDVEEPRANAQFERNSILIKAGRQRDVNRRMDVVLQLNDREQGVPHFRNLENNEASYSTTNTQLQWNHRTQASDQSNWNHTQSLYVHDNNEIYDDRLDQIGVADQLTDIDVTVFGGRSYWDYPGENGTFALNLDVRQERLDHNEKLVGQDYEATRNRFNASVQYSRFSFDERLLGTFALRHVSTRDTFNGILSNGSSTARSDAATAQLGFRWQPDIQWLNVSANPTNEGENFGIGSQWTVFGNLGQHRREPVFFELFGDRGLFRGNENLNAENGLNADLGIEWQRQARQRIGVTLFASWFDQLIVVAHNSRGIGRSENTGEARIYGLETFFNWQWSRHWQTQLNVTVQTTENRAAFAAYQGKQLPGEAALAAYGQIRYQKHRWSTWYETDVMRDRYYDLPNDLPAEDTWLHHLGVTYSHKNLTTSFILRNITNQFVQDYNGFPRPGRSFNLTFTYAFDGEKHAK